MARVLTTTTTSTGSPYSTSKATELFADPDFDGEPVQVYQPHSDDAPIVPEDEQTDVYGVEEESAEDEANTEGVETDWAEYEVDDNAIWESDDSDGLGTTEKPEPRRKYVVDDVEVSIVAERVQYLGPDGKLITESLRDYTRQQVQAQYATLNDFYAVGSKRNASRPFLMNWQNRVFSGKS